jgi:hypothetical protein
MRKHNEDENLAAVLAAASLTSAVKADIVWSTYRTPNLTITGYDSVMIFARNTGTGTTAGDPLIGTISMTITDTTSPGLVLGVFKSGTKFYGDPDGVKKGGTDNGTFTSSNPTPVYGTYPNYPTDQSVTGKDGVGQQMYSWIGNGALNSGDTLADSNPSNATSSTTVSGTGFANPVASLYAIVAWTSQIDASADAGGLNGLGYYGGALDERGAWVGLAVVPHNDTVTYAGYAFGATGASQDFSGQDGGTAVPEPASLGVLALGALALLARRRK